jgi:hypothetical protein
MSWIWSDTIIGRTYTRRFRQQKLYTCGSSGKNATNDPRSAHRSVQAHSDIERKVARGYGTDQTVWYSKRSGESVFAI